MQRKLFYLLFLTALVPGLLFSAGKGKISGKVVDAGTGEALVGANVVVAGTSMGAATNTVGEFTILNVEPGTYTLKATYISYQQITVSNVRVNADLTTTQDFSLPAEGVQVATVEIVAERPLVNRNATNAVRIVDQEFFDKIPARGVNAAIAAQPGVTYQGGTFYIRGSRGDEAGFRVEGVNTTNIVDGGSGLYTTAEAVEQIQVQAGGFNAEYGGANAGLIQSTLRTGSPDRWKASILGETDRYAKYGKKSLGGYSYGYSDMTATFGGPILSNKFRFFGAIQNTFQRDNAISVRQPYTFTNLVTDNVLTPKHKSTPGTPDTIPLVSVGGNSLGGQDNRWAYTGSLLYDAGALQVRGAGSFSFDRSRDATTFGNYLNQARLPLRETSDGFGNLKLTYMISPTTFVEANGNYYYRKAIVEDPDFKSDLFAYGDSLRNAQLGYYLKGPGQNYGTYGFFNGAFTMNQPGTQVNAYSKSVTKSWGGRIDLTSQYKQHEFKAGGEYTRYTIRRFNPAGVITWAKLRQDAPNAAELENLLNKSTGVGSDIIGYDIFGNEVNSDVVKNGAIYYLAPRHPVFAAGYIQDKIEFSDIILNLGLRFDYIDPASVDTKSQGDLQFNADNWIMASDVIATEKTKQISPRIGFSFPVTDRTVFHAQYGKFIQQSRLNDSYRGMGTMAGNIKGGFWVAAPNGWGLKPERTTQYELGFSQQISDFASFDVTAFYKDIQDQIQFEQVQVAAGGQTPVYSTLANRDFTTSQGLEMKFVMRRTNRIQAQVNYTFSDARSTASSSRGSNGIWQLGLGPEALPHVVFPTDFDQMHRGTIILDYRYGKDDGGPVLSQLGMNLMLNFNSGHPITRLDAQQAGPNPTDERFRIPLEPINASTTPWFFQLDARIDKTVPIGPLDVNFYVYVINLLGTKNAQGAFIRTADPSSDGWFTIGNGQTAAQTLGADYVNMYNLLNLGDNSGNWGPPRQIRFGIRLDY
jgi:outer membrane receptor protein involved in Fe transport